MEPKIPLPLRMHCHCDLHDLPSFHAIFSSLSVRSRYDPQASRIWKPSPIPWGLSSPLPTSTSISRTLRGFQGSIVFRIITDNPTGRYLPADTGSYCRLDFLDLSITLSIFTNQLSSSSLPYAPGTLSALPACLVATMLLTVRQCLGHPRTQPRAWG